MRSLGLKGKLILAFLFAGLVPMICVGVFSFKKSSESLEKEAVGKLVAVRDVKGGAVKRYFEAIGDRAVTFAHTVSIVDAMKGFSKGFKDFGTNNSFAAEDIRLQKVKLRQFYQNEFGKKYEKENGKPIDVFSLLNQLSDSEVALQYAYIANNPNPLGSKEVLDFAADESEYSKLHKTYHPSIREYLQKFGYYDIFLVDIDSGNIVYSVYKELDFGTSLLSGPYSNTNFAEAFKKARGISDKKSTVLVDYKKYTPSFEAPASFIAAPIWDGSKKIGVAMFQMPINRLNLIMGERSGMGNTGETIIVGQDTLMRSDSFLKPKTHSVLASFKNQKEGSIKNHSVKEALNGVTNHFIESDYMGKKSIMAFTPISILGQLNWALVAKIHTEEAFSAAESLKSLLFILFGGTVVGIMILALFLSSSISKDVTRNIRVVAEKLIKGADLILSSSNTVSKNSTELSEAATEQAASLQETVSSIDEISSMVQKNAESASSSSQVSDKSYEAAERGKKTVESMISSINDIADSNNEIMEEMKESNEEISKIVTVISEIGNKTKVINDIVFQTKLLSFNASVEAARAGEHGRGFAVVAEEVGNLAAMSGKAALEITEMLDKSIKQVTDIVTSTKSKVEGLVSTGRTKVEMGIKTANECGDSLDDILCNVGSVNEMVKEIASASAEQSTGVKQVTKAMQQLDETTHQNSSVAQQSSEMAGQLKAQADSLGSAIEELMAIVGAGGEKVVVKEKSTKKEQRENVVDFKKSKHKEVLALGGEVKVSGLDTSIPSEDDPRFEDL
ncbi:MAG: methyl-accepting chemotaxis protein [Bacteriovoracaceae bacterium]|jgi:methyl-accepting chemotaxis protein|nr:methyl-accepting chemotaxis protein [Bacteriovoracaceae bacterium]